MFDLNTTPGLYELVDCGDGTAGTLLAALIARQVEHAWWFTTSDSYAPALYAHARYCPERLYQVGLVPAVFEAIKGICDMNLGNLAVIDALAGMRGAHPESRTIATDVKRAVMGWEPTIPVLVVNQWRHPAPPGGVYWRGRVNSRHLLPLRERPLIALLEDFQEGRPPLFLVWYPNYRPELRPLKSVEWSYFFPDGVPGYQVFIRPGQPVTVRSIALKEQRRPWLIGRRATT